MSQWDECICKDCGHRWFASEDEHFNMSFCYMCHSTKIGGKYHEPEKKKAKKALKKGIRPRKGKYLKGQKYRQIEANEARGL